MNGQPGMSHQPTLKREVTEVLPKPISRPVADRGTAELLPTPGHRPTPIRGTIDASRKSALRPVADREAAEVLATPGHRPTSRREEARASPKPSLTTMAARHPANAVQAAAHPQGSSSDDSWLWEQMARVGRGEMTLAELEGTTWEQAKSIAQIGCELAARGRLKDACVIFEGLVAGNPRDTSAHAALGTIYLRLERLPEARSCFDRALELFEANIVALAHRGELRLRLGDVGGAEDLAKAVKFDVNGASASARRARALLAGLRPRSG